MKLTEIFLPSLLLTFLLEVPIYAQKNKCPKISIQNGRVKLRARGKMAYFKCRKRYSRLGDKFAVCLQAGTWSHPPPLCISQGCPSLGVLPNMQISESYNGAMLKFQCPVGTKRNGPEIITCDGKKWSDAAPNCETGLTLGCNFEKEGLCGWSQDESDNFDWTRKSGRTPTMSTGPPGDHTTGSGFYMFIESSSPRKLGDMARLISPAYPPTLKNICFEFWYHMQGPADENAVGSLEVYIKPETADLVDIDPEFYMDGNQGPDWQRGLVHIPNQDENFKIIIVGTRKDAFVSDIAIDDLRMFNCSEETTTPIPTTTTTTTKVVGNMSTTESDNITDAFSGLEVTTKAMTVTNVPSQTANKTDVSTVSKTMTTSVTSATSTLKTSPTTLQTTPTTTTWTYKPTTTAIVTTTSSTYPTTKMTKMPSTAKAATVTSSPTPSATTTTKETAKKQTTTPIPSMAVTTVYNFSNLGTDVMEISTTQSPTTQTEEPHFVTQMDTSSPSDDSVTSSGEDNLFPGTMGNDINTPPTSTVNNRSPLSTTDLSNVIPTVIADNGDLRQRSGGSASIMPLVIGITTGIVVGMVVIGILAWLWARNQRKRKEREAAEDEMYMLSTGDAAGYNYK